MLMLSVLETQPAWMYTAAADEQAALTTDTWLHYTPGVPGLENAILEHLVQSRYAAAVAGSPQWGIRTATEIHSAVSGHHATVAQTEAALRVLEGRGLVVVDTVADVSGWRASGEGAAAFDHAIDARHHPLAA